MKQLTNTNKLLLKEIGSYFTLPEISYVFWSYSESLTPGELFVNDLNEPLVSVFWDKRSSIYFGGDTSRESHYKEAIEYAVGNILKRVLTKEHFHLKIGYSSEKWERMIRSILYEYNPKIRDRFLYKHSLENIPESKDLDNTLSVQEISKDLLEKKHFKNNTYLVEEIKSMWGEIEIFLKNGIGFCAVENKEILCWCTMEYLSNHSICGIGIETIRNAQNRGIATALTHAFLQKCSQMQIIPYWDCWKSNIPSVKTAQKAGFSLLSKYQVLSISK